MKPAKARTVRLGMAGYARLLATLRDAPSTSQQLQQRAMIGHTTAVRVLAGMHMLGMIHISVWSMEPNQPTLPIFKAGGAPDAPVPTMRPNGRPMVAARVVSLKNPPPELIAFKGLLAAIEDPSSRLEISAKSGLNNITVRTAVEALIKHRLARIACWQWRNHGGAPIPQYQIGPGAAASRPARMGGREIQARYRARKREALPFIIIGAALSRLLERADCV